MNAKNKSEAQVYVRACRLALEGVKLWNQLTLEEQLNCWCDGLAKSTATHLIEGFRIPTRGKPLLLLKKAVLFINDEKCTTDVTKEVRFCLREVEACEFFTAFKSKGGLGWSHHRFNQVFWWAIDAALDKKPDYYRLWPSKQASGWCATRKQIARIQDLLADKCPNCQQVAESLDHLNCCPDEGRTMLFRERVDLLSKWLNENDQTNPELKYQISS